jgi:RNA polymerase sigma-70 factor (ECF subfamily)
MSRDDAQAVELVQDVFVRAWERLPSFKGASSFATWLHRVATNVVLGALRSTRRRERYFLEETDAGPSDTPALRVDVDARIDMMQALSQLPVGSRSVFVLHDIYGYQHEEIARMVGTAPSTVRVQLWRARRALARILEP